MRVLEFLGMFESVGRSTALLLYRAATVSGLRVAKALFHREKRPLTWSVVAA